MRTVSGGLQLSGRPGRDLRSTERTGAHGEPGKAPNKLRIIVADDDRDQVLTLMTLLRDEGHEVQGLFRGKELVNAVKEFRPDALILDIKLPDASGFEIAEQVRRRFGNSTPLMIAMSGVFKKGVDRILAEMVGFDHHLTKPFEFETLLELIAPLTLPGRRDN